MPPGQDFAQELLVGRGGGGRLGGGLRGCSWFGCRVRVHAAREGGPSPFVPPCPVRRPGVAVTTRQRREGWGGGWPRRRDRGGCSTRYRFRLPGAGTDGWSWAALPVGVQVARTCPGRTSVPGVAVRWADALADDPPSLRPGWSAAAPPDAGPPCLTPDAHPGPGLAVSRAPAAANGCSGRSPCSPGWGRSVVISSVVVSGHGWSGPVSVRGRSGWAGGRDDVRDEF